MQREVPSCQPGEGGWQFTAYGAGNPSGIWGQRIRTVEAFEVCNYAGTGPKATNAVQHHSTSAATAGESSVDDGSGWVVIPGHPLLGGLDHGFLLALFVTNYANYS